MLLQNVIQENLLITLEVVRLFTSIMCQLDIFMKSMIKLTDCKDVSTKTARYIMKCDGCLKVVGSGRSAKEDLHHKS